MCLAFVFGLRTSKCNDFIDMRGWSMGGGGVGWTGRRMGERRGRGQECG